MTLASTLTKNRWLGNGTLKEFSYAFKIFSAEHLVVIISDENDSVASRTTLTLNSDYTVSGVGSDTGGDITLLGDAVPDNWYITIYRSTPKTQDTLYEEGGDFKLTQLMRDLDEATMKMQEMAEEIARAPKVSVSSALSGDQTIQEIEASVLDAAASATIATMAKNDAEDAKDAAQLAQTAAEEAAAAWNLQATGNLINSASNKDTPVDADHIGLMDSVAGNLLKKLSWANIKATLKVYFDSLYTTVGEVKMYAGITEPAGYFFLTGLAKSKTTYSNLWNKLHTVLGTFTVTAASPGRFTLTAHGRATGDCVFLTTTGALLTNLAVDTNYFVIVDDADHFWLATSYANAIAGTKINTSGSQSGVHTCTYAPWGISGANSFLLPDAQAATIRGVGTSTKFTANKTIGLGQVIDDQGQGHWHYVGNDTSPINYTRSLGGVGGAYNDAAGAGSVAPQIDRATGLVTDGVNGTPRTGNETTGKAIGMNYIIKY